jgi:hypothetical protein
MKAFILGFILLTLVWLFVPLYLTANSINRIPEPELKTDSRFEYSDNPWGCPSTEDKNI